MTTRDEAYNTVYLFIGPLLTSNPYTATVDITNGILDKLIAYGIHPNAIKAAFSEEVKRDVDKANES